MKSAKAEDQKTEETTEEKLQGLRERLSNLNLEITMLKDNNEKTSTSIKEINEMLEKDSPRNAKIKEDIEEIRKTKADVLAYTLQVVSIVVGILAVILSISFVFIYRDDLGNLSAWLIMMISFFAFIFVFWFIVWMRKEKIFKFLDDVKTDDQKTDEKLYWKRLSNWLVFAIGLFCFYIICYYATVILLINFPMLNWNLILTPLFIVVISLIINYVPGLDTLKRIIWKASSKKLVLILIILALVVVGFTFFVQSLLINLFG